MRLSEKVGIPFLCSSSQAFIFVFNYVIIILTRQRTPSFPPPHSPTALLITDFIFFACSGMRVWQADMQAVNLELISAQSLPWVCSKAGKPSSPTPAPQLILEIADTGKKRPRSPAVKSGLPGRWTQSLTPHVRRPSPLPFVFQVTDSPLFSASFSFPSVAPLSPHPFHLSPRSPQQKAKKSFFVSSPRHLSLAHLCLPSIRKGGTSQRYWV